MADENDNGGAERPQRSLVDRWEALPMRVHLAIVYPIALVLLFVIHEAFFPLLSVGRSLMYAIFEAPIFAAFVAVATASEKARKRSKRDADSAMPEDPDSPR